MVITATEAKTNFGKYLILSETQDIYITKNGTIVSKLSKPTVDKAQLLDSIVGIAKGSFDEADMKEERLKRQ